MNPPPATPFSCLLDTAQPGLPAPEVTVVIPLYNYRGHVLEALESVRAQTLAALDLIVVDDGSTDGGTEAAKAWLEQEAGRFCRARLLRHQRNSGLAASRNTGFLEGATPFVLPLDADNLLFPTCLAKLLRALRDSTAAFAYCLVERFGPGLPEDEPPLMHLEPWQPARLARANYIDAMVLLRRAAWVAVGGYTRTMPAPGWEDYDLWLKLARAGERGLQVLQVLARYRVHPNSMLRAVTNRKDSQERLHAYLRANYPDVFSPAAS